MRQDMRRALILLLLAGALAGFPTIATAGFLGNLITIEATNATGRGTWQFPVPANPPDTINYAHPDVVVLRDQNQAIIGTVDDIAVNLDGDPVASISFVATAGASPTTFSVSSAVVTFPAITNPAASATAEVTLTDTSTNGASLTPVSPNTGVFLPTYNGSTIYTQLIGTTTISSGGSITANGAFNDPIAGAVSSIQARFNFTLSAADVASGTGRFEVIPEPTTLVLLAAGAACAAAAGLRRRTAAPSSDRNS
jgi:hypothetical protein